MTVSNNKNAKRLLRPNVNCQVWMVGKSYLDIWSELSQKGIERTQILNRDQKLLYGAVDIKHSLTIDKRL